MKFEFCPGPLLSCSRVLGPGRKGGGPEEDLRLLRAQSPHYSRLNITSDTVSVGTQLATNNEQEGQ